MRLFVALDLPGEARELIAAWQARQTEPRLRPVAPEALHVTVAFLGEQPPDSIPEIDSVIAEAADGVEEPLLGRLEPAPIALPKRGPRVVALEIVSPAAEALVAAVSGSLVGRGLYQPERRRWLPHATAFRIREAGRDLRPPELTPLETIEAVELSFERLCLYRSDLEPEGARYTRLAEAALPL